MRKVQSSIRNICHCRVSKLYHSGRCCSDSRATERKSRLGTNNMTRCKGNVEEQKLIPPDIYLLSPMSNLYHTLQSSINHYPSRKGEIVVASHRVVCHSYRMWSEQNLLGLMTLSQQNCVLPSPCGQ